jgi:hypothetical protein
MLVYHNLFYFIFLYITFISSLFANHLVLIVRFTALVSFLFAAAYFAFRSTCVHITSNSLGLFFLLRLLYPSSRI